MALRIVRTAFSPTGSSTLRLRLSPSSTRCIHSFLNQHTLTFPNRPSHIYMNNTRHPSSQQRHFTKDDNKNDDQSSPITPNNKSTTHPILIYESPFASLTLKLKRVSLTSAAVGLIGLPLLSYFYGATDVPATGQLAVIATAGITAVGSTMLLGYCFTPYVHTLELLTATTTTDGNDDEEEEEEEEEDGKLFRMITRDILTRRVETIFTSRDVSMPSSTSNYRPFCNFMVRDRPFYVHPDLIEDEEVRLMLFGDDGGKEKVELEVKKKTDDDEFV